MPTIYINPKGWHSSPVVSRINQTSSIKNNVFTLFRPLNLESSLLNYSKFTCKKLFAIRFCALPKFNLSQHPIGLLPASSKEVVEPQPFTPTWKGGQDGSPSPIPLEQVPPIECQAGGLAL